MTDQIEYLDTPQGRRIACRRSPGAGPGVVFLGGFRSDMDGSKAEYLHAWAGARGRAFLRLDYSGHGRSGGRFEDGCIGDWAEDAAAAVTALTEGPQVLVGSSMGGWIALLLARAMPDRVAGVVGVAAAPDFTEDSFWADMDDTDRALLITEGHVLRPSEYEAPYVVTRRLIEDGRERLVLRSPLRMDCPVRLLQGDADDLVPTELALRLLRHIEGPDLRLTVIAGADHRFSTPDCLDLIAAAVEETLARAGA